MSWLRSDVPPSPASMSHSAEPRSPSECAGRSPSHHGRTASSSHHGRTASSDVTLGRAASSSHHGRRSCARRMAADDTEAAPPHLPQALVGSAGDPFAELQDAALEPVPVPAQSAQIVLKTEIENEEDEEAPRQLGHLSVLRPGCDARSLLERARSFLNELAVPEGPRHYRDFGPRHYRDFGN